MGKLCLISLVALYDVLTDWIEGRRAMDVVHLHFSKVFDALITSLLRNLENVGYMSG